jgi:spermidine/putrescine transport system substrate-binding protein
MERRRIESTVEQAVERALTRRRLLGRMGSLAVASSSLGAVLAACGGDDGGAKPAPTAVAGHHPKVPLTEMTFSNWPLYIDKKVLRAFERRFHLDLRYREDINDNEEFFAKVRQQLQAGRPTGRDLVALTDWMASRWIRLGYLEKIDQANIPNVRTHLSATLRSPVFDPGREYTAPWQSGITAIGYNRRAVGELRSLEQIFDPRYKGKVSFLSDARDASGLVMLMQGVKPEHAGIDDVLKAIDRIDEASRAGQVRRFTGNDYTTDLAKGNVVIAMAYAADLIQLKADNPDLDFAVPEEGAILWSDNMMIPKGAEHPYAAETWMNYVYDPQVAARITRYVGSITPVDGVREVLERTDPKLAGNPLVFPDDETKSRLSGYPSLSSSEERRMNERYAEVTGA